MTTSSKPAFAPPYGPQIRPWNFPGVITNERRASGARSASSHRGGRASRTRNHSMRLFSDQRCDSLVIPDPAIISFEATF
jgi:hypothetical protein